VSPESSAWSEGLRERKKRLTRSLISDTATAMFLERGFDDVKVADVAEACGVSEKTVYNYFPTKESLLFDREPEVAAEIWQALGPGSPDRSPVEGVLGLLEANRTERLSDWDKEGRELLRRFSALIDANPSLQTAHREMSDRLGRTAAEALAERAGVRPDDPEPRVAAAALITMWLIQDDLLRRCAAEERSAEETRELVRTEVQRAARVAESGLWWFGAMADGRPTRQQLKVAAETALTAGRQVISAVRQARTAWEQLQHEGSERGGEDPYAFPGVAHIIEETERLKLDMRAQRDEWKRAYRDQQLRIRLAQRELAQRYRQVGRQRHQSGWRPPGPMSGADDSPED
jgi:AcrR family transcriptional regulator